MNNSTGWIILVFGLLLLFGLAYSFSFDYFKSKWDKYKYKKLLEKEKSPHIKKYNPIFRPKRHKGE